MEIVLPGAETPKTTVWDNFVPIIKVGTHTDVYLTASIEAPEEYNELIHRLGVAEKYETFTLHLNNPGGYVDSGFMLIDALATTKAKTKAKLSGTVASVATLITLSCDTIEVANHLSWLSHNYSGGVQGKGGEMKAQMEFMTREISTSFREIHKGFFTPEEMEDIIEDNDIWLNRSEVLARWDARKAGDDKALLAIATKLKTKNKK